MVPCKCCSSDKLDFTTKEVNSILRDGVINVSLRYREGYWDPIDQLTLEEAIEKVPQDYRSPLRIIQFLNKEGYNEMWTWRGLDVEKEWGDINFWVKSTDDNTIIDEVHLKDGAVSQEKLSKELQDNLAHKAVVLTYGRWQEYDKIPEIIKQYKGDENKSVFIVQKDGMYFPAQLLYNEGSEAIVFFQPEGTNLRKFILRATGKEEVVIYGDTVRYGNQTLTPEQKEQARQNIGALKEAAGAVQTENLADAAVTTPKIADKAVTRDKLADNSVTTHRIVNLNVTTEKLANESVTDQKLAPLSVGETRIKNLAVTEPKLSKDLQGKVNNNVKTVVQTFTKEQQSQARKNIDAATKAYVLTYDASSDDTEAIIAAFKNDANGTQLYVKDDNNYLIPAMIADNSVMAVKVMPVFKIPGGNVTDIKRYFYSMIDHRWSTLTATNVANYGLSYGAQNLSNAQKAQARKNIDVDYLTEDEVANLWDTTK